MTIGPPESSDSLTASADALRAAKLSLFGLLVTAVLQLVVYMFSGSVALLADTIHNFVDAATGLPLWVALAWGRRLPVRGYSYGYGRGEDLAAIVVVAAIAASAIGIGWQSIASLIDPRPMTNVWLVATAAIIGVIGNEVVAQYRLRVGRRTGSAALVAEGQHARADGLTSLAVLVAAIGVWSGFPQADGLVGLVITAAILLILKDVARQVWRRLMDAVDPELLGQVERAANEPDGVMGVNSVRARWIGHEIHAEVTIVAHCDVTLRAAHAIAEDARHAMLHAVPRLTDVTVHVDPCGHDGHDPHAELAHHDVSVTAATR
jgi:cation diffusion facilitator family transporter